MLSIIIPSYDHSGYLQKNIPKIQKYFSGTEHEIIVVDDGSADDTAAVAESLGVRLIRNPSNKGKGYSLRRGIEAANGEHILLTDTDLATPIEEFSKLWKHRDNDVVIGSRKADGQRARGVSLDRQIAGYIFSELVRLVLSPGLQDTQCGFKLLKKDVKPIASSCVLDGFVFDAELLKLCRIKGLSIREVGVDWHAKEDSRVRLSSHPFQMLYELLRLRYRLAREKYG